MHVARCSNFVENEGDEATPPFSLERGRELMRTSCNETDWVGRSLLTEVSHAHECTRGETDAMRADSSSPSIQKGGANELDLVLQDGIGACVMSACKVVPCLRADMRGGRHSSVRRVSFALGSGMIREGCGKGERAVSEAFLGVFGSNTGSEDVTVLANSRINFESDSREVCFTWTEIWTEV